MSNSRGICGAQRCVRGSFLFILASPGLVPKRSGQVQEEPAPAGEHGGGQGVRRLDAAGRDAVGPGLWDLQRLHESFQHTHHPYGLDQPHHAHRHICAHLSAGWHGRPRVPEPNTDHADQPLLMYGAPPAPPRLPQLPPCSPRLLLDLNLSTVDSFEHLMDLENKRKQAKKVSFRACLISEVAEPCRRNICCYFDVVVLRTEETWFAFFNVYRKRLKLVKKKLEYCFFFQHSIYVMLYKSHC